MLQVQNSFLHPIAQSVFEGYEGPLLPATNIQEFAGEGILLLKLTANKY